MGVKRIIEARRWALATALSFGLLTAPGPQPVDVLPGPAKAEIPLGGIEEVFANECTESVCVEVNLKVIKVTFCRSRTYDC